MSAVKAEPVAPPKPATWYPERFALARALHRRRWALDAIAEHLTVKTPGLPVSAREVRERLYGEARF